MQTATPIIIDIVDSRLAANRLRLHERVYEVFADVDSAVPAHTPLWATVGDEFQVVYPTLDDALAATALTRLLCTEGLDLRFGIGVGSIRTLTAGERGPIEDGPGWYRARESLEELTRLQSHGHPWLRTWVTTTDGSDTTQTLTRAFLSSRDHIISRMKNKEKRITANWLLGETQQQIARTEKVSQAAVSQKLETSGGAAIMHANNLLLLR